LWANLKIKIREYYFFENNFYKIARIYPNKILLIRALSMDNKASILSLSTILFLALICIWILGGDINMVEQS
jgi:hypothetical protein